MKFTLSIDCSNAAFCDDDGEPDPRWEVARILAILAEHITDVGVEPGMRLYDINGNLVGKVTLSEDSD